MKTPFLAFFLTFSTFGSFVFSQAVYNGSDKHTFTTNHGKIEIGPFNTSWAHIYTDRPKIIFNKDVYTTTNAFSSYNNDLIFKTKGNERMRINDDTGYVGIGTSTPEYRLHVPNGVKFRKTTIGATVGNADNSWVRDDWLTGNYGPPKWDNTLQKWVRPEGAYNDVGGIVWQNEGTYFIRKGHGSQIEFSNTELLETAFLFAHINTGDVGIGTNDPDAKLTVNGNIHAEEVKVDLNVPGPDYVFKEAYDLKSLEEVQNYIKTNGHLPNIPSAQEMEANGIELGEMNMKLLEKIEELTLYTIEQEKQIRIYKNRLLKETEVNTNQEERIAKLEEFLIKKN